MVAETSIVLRTQQMSLLTQSNNMPKGVGMMPAALLRDGGSDSADNTRV
mgnify:CR=1 FL=1